MKITFLVGSMKVASNGVAAYTKKLSEQLMTLGQEVNILTTNEDRAVYFENNIFVIQKELSIIKRYFKLKEILDKLKPDYISIQFVPYSFHKKGLYLELLLFSLILKKFKVHLMVHEPWIEITKQTSIKNRIISKMQHALFFSFSLIVSPDIVTSTIPHYLNLLGRGAKLLPLFSNISYHPNSKFITKNTNELRCVIFGTISSDTIGLTLQLNWIKKYCNYNNLVPKITLIGENGIPKVNTILMIKSLIGEDHIIDLGWKSEEEISHVLQEQDLGISRATPSLFGKSGSTLAILEHGLPVLLRGKDNGNIDLYLNTININQLIQISENYNFRFCRFEPRIDSINIHSQKFLGYLNESLLPS